MVAARLCLSRLRVELMDNKTKAWVITIADEIIVHIQNAKRFESSLQTQEAVFEYIRAGCKASSARRVCEDNYICK